MNRPLICIIRLIRVPMRRKKEFTFIEKKKVVSKELVREIMFTLVYCFAAALFAAVLVIAFGMKIPVIGVSMEPGLENGQQVLVDRFLYGLSSPNRGDVVCFYPKGNENSHLYVKRIVGLPGESVEIIGGYVYIDGVRLPESEEYDKIEEAGDASGPFLLGEEEYFVLGDNRNNSEDSRNGNIGAVRRDTILGRAWFKLSAGESKADLIR